MSVVIDACVAAKWVIDEESSDRARILRRESALIAPALIAAEVGSVLWKAVRRGEFRKADTAPSMKSVLGVFSELVPDEELANRALDIAIALDHPIYDCFYLALAERERAPIVSADRRLLEAASRLKDIELRPL